MSKSDSTVVLLRSYGGVHATQDTVLRFDHGGIEPSRIARRRAKVKRIRLRCACTAQAQDGEGIFKEAVASAMREWWIMPFLSLSKLAPDIPPPLAVLLQRTQEHTYTT